jgi:hypothetical protein
LAAAKIHQVLLQLVREDYFSTRQTLTVVNHREPISDAARLSGGI